MFQRLWKFLENSFLIRTKDNYKLYLAMSLFHYNILKRLGATDTFIKQLFTNYEPLHLAFKAAYMTWNATKDSQVSTTESLEKKLEELSGKLAKKWDLAVQAVFDDTTDEYRAIFTHHRRPFMEGGQDERIAAVGVLGEKLEDYPALAPLEAEVKGFYNSLVEKDENKDGGIVDTGKLSHKVEAARVAAAWVMYGNLGLAMAEYKQDIDKTELLFPVKLVRDEEQMDFLGHVAEETVENILRRFMKPGQTITKKNNGQGALVFFAAANKDQKTATKMFTVQPGETLVTTAEDFGNTKETPFINVYNSSALVEGEFEVTLS